jgi:hypothetical protein
MAKKTAEAGCIIDPEWELEVVVDDDCDLYCQIEALNILRDWENGDTPLKTRRAQADAFFLRWGFIGRRASEAAKRGVAKLRGLL